MATKKTTKAVAKKPARKARPSTPASAKRAAVAAPRRDTIVLVRINPLSLRQTHTVEGVVFKAGETRAYDIRDPASAAFVERLRSKHVQNRPDKRTVFLVETKEEAAVRVRHEEEARRAPRGSVGAPIAGIVPKKAKPRDVDKYAADDD